MTSLAEMKKKGYMPSRTYLQLMVKGLSSLARVLLSNLSAVRRLQETDSDGPVYVRPPRRYELPSYDESMPYCDCDERYLRPTLYCNSHAPEVVALANELGAFEVSDREFAERAFDFAKRKLTLEMLPMDDVSAILRRGTGTCLHEISVFVALCRAAGIKARYKLYAPELIEAWSDTFIVDPMMQEWYDAMGYFMLHGEGEAYVDGSWEVVDVGPTPERQAATGIPITGFGEDSIGVWFAPRPESVMHLESFPYGLGLLLKLATVVAPGTIAKVNTNVQQQIESGKQLLAKVGGEEAYNHTVREQQTPSPKVQIEPRQEIVFEG